MHDEQSVAVEDLRVPSIRGAPSEEGPATEGPTDGASDSAPVGKVIVRAMTYRVYPTREQDRLLRQWEQALGALWNVALEQYHRRWLTSNDEPMPPPRAVLKEDRDEALRAAKAGERRVRTLPTAVEQSRELTEVRAEAPEWLAEWQRTRSGLEPPPIYRIADVPRFPCAEVLNDLGMAWQRHFAEQRSLAAERRRLLERGRVEEAKKLVDPEKGRPRFKILRRNPEIGLRFHAQHGFRFSGAGWKGELLVPRMKDPLKVLVHRPLSELAPDGGEVQVTTWTLVRDVDQWFLRVTYKRTIPEVPLKTGPVVALELGVLQPLVDSDGRVVVNPKRIERFDEQLTAARQELSWLLECAKKRAAQRRAQGLPPDPRFKGANITKARERVAKIERKMRRVRDHFLAYESNHYTRGHARAPASEAGVILVGKLATRELAVSAKGTVEEPGEGVARRARLNRSILDVAWYDLETRMRYKADECGKQVLQRDVAYESQTCSECGVVDPDSRPETLVFRCVACGHTENADTNAAKVRLRRVCLPGQTHLPAPAATLDKKPQREKLKMRQARRKGQA